MNADLRGKHVDALKAIRSAFDGIPAPCAERDALDYAIERLSVAQGQGFVMVPQDPTPEMIEAGIMFGTSPNKACIIYQSMVPAAPAQPDGVE